MGPSEASISTPQLEQFCVSKSREVEKRGQKVRGAHASRNKRGATNKPPFSFSLTGPQCLLWPPSSVCAGRKSKMRHSEQKRKHAKLTAWFSLPSFPFWPRLLQLPRLLWYCCPSCRLLPPRSMTGHWCEHCSRPTCPPAHCQGELGKQRGGKGETEREKRDRETERERKRRSRKRKQRKRRKKDHSSKPTSESTGV
jgi:hypothetical protein